MEKRQSSSFFASLFGRAEKHKTATVTRGTPAAPRPFQAISIHPGAICCAQARQADQYRFLGKNAPQLPLTECTMSATCKCRYVKHADRRSGSRRDSEFGLKSALFAAAERRRSSGRRKDD